MNLTKLQAFLPPPAFNMSPVVKPTAAEVAAFTEVELNDYLGRLKLRSGAWLVHRDLLQSRPDNINIAVVSLNFGTLKISNLPFSTA